MTYQGAAVCGLTGTAYPRCSATTCNALADGPTDGSVVVMATSAADGKVLVAVTDEFHLPGPADEAVLRNSSDHRRREESDCRRIPGSASPSCGRSPAPWTGTPGPRARFTTSPSVLTTNTPLIPAFENGRGRLPVSPWTDDRRITLHRSHAGDRPEEHASRCPAVKPARRRQSASGAPTPAPRSATPSAARGPSPPSLHRPVLPPRGRRRPRAMAAEGHGSVGDTRPDRSGDHVDLNEPSQWPGHAPPVVRGPRPAPTMVAYRTSSARERLGGSRRVEMRSSAPVPAAALAKAINAAGYDVGRPPGWQATPTSGDGRGRRGPRGRARRTRAGIAPRRPRLGRRRPQPGRARVALLLGLVRQGVDVHGAGRRPLVLALPRRSGQPSSPGDARCGVSRDAARAVFMAGRIIGYGVHRGRAGCGGASVAIPPRVTAVLMIAGDRDDDPRDTAHGPRPGRDVGTDATHRTRPPARARRRGGRGNQYSDTRAAFLGAASFFLPCGSPQAVPVYPLSTGSPVCPGRSWRSSRSGHTRAARVGLPVVVPERDVAPALLHLVASSSSASPSSSDAGIRPVGRTFVVRHRVRAARRCRRPTWRPTGRGRSRPSRTQAGTARGNLSISTASDALDDRVVDREHLRRLPQSSLISASRSAFTKGRPDRPAAMPDRDLGLLLLDGDVRAGGHVERPTGASGGTQVGGLACA